MVQVQTRDDKILTSPLYQNMNMGICFHRMLTDEIFGYHGAQLNAGLNMPPTNSR